MKKICLLAPVALAVAVMAGSVSAATVKITGTVDMGINFTQKDKTGKATENITQLISGQNSTSKFAFKGSEDLGNGLKVGFNLESGFEADTGELKGDRLFQREALVWITGNWGEIGMGRCGVLDSGNGRYGLLDDDVTPFGTGWEDIGDSRTVFLGQHTRTDNVLTYATPEFAGFTGYLQMSTQMEAVQTDKNYYSKDEGNTKANRYYAIGAKYNAGAFTGVAVVSRVDISDTLKKEGDGDGDSLTCTVAGAYDFGDVKLMLGAEYYDSGFAFKKKNFEEGGFKWAEDEDALDSLLDAKGWGVVLGGQAKALGGKFYGLLGYADGETVSVKSKDIEVYSVGLGYEYKFSKTTYIYAGAGYNHEKVGDKTTKLTQVMSGLVKKF